MVAPCARPARDAPASAVCPPVALVAPGAGGASDVAEGSAAASWDLSPCGFFNHYFIKGVGMVLSDNFLRMLCQSCAALLFLISQRCQFVLLGIFMY